MANIINVTACDNELILTAYQGGGSYVLCRILSGNTNSVNIKINIYEAQYQGALLLDGTLIPLSGTYNVALAKGKYDLVGVGIDWGGPQNFAFTLNGPSVPFIPTGQADGVVKFTAPTPIAV